MAISAEFVANRSTGRSPWAAAMMAGIEVEVTRPPTAVAPTILEKVRLERVILLPLSRPQRQHAGNPSPVDPVVAVADVAHADTCGMPRCGGDGDRGARGERRVPGIRGGGAWESTTPARVAMMYDSVRAIVA